MLITLQCLLMMRRWFTLMPYIALLARDMMAARPSDVVKSRLDNTGLAAHNT